MNIAFAGQAGTGDTSLTLTDCRDLAEYQATLPVYSMPDQELAVADEPETGDTSLTLNDCQDWPSTRRRCRYSVPDQEVAVDEAESGEAVLTLDDCLDLSEYQATLPHIP